MLAHDFMIPTTKKCSYGQLDTLYTVPANICRAETREISTQQTLDFIWLKRLTNFHIHQDTLHRAGLGFCFTANTANRESAYPG